jgi:hypothetical protein
MLNHTFQGPREDHKSIIRNRQNSSVDRIEDPSNVGMLLFLKRFKKNYPVTFFFNYQYRFIV